MIKRAFAGREWYVAHCLFARRDDEAAAAGGGACS